MKKARSIIALLLVLVMALSLVGCATDTPEAETPEEPAEETPAEEPADEPEEPAEEPAADKRILNIWGWNEEFKDRFEAYYVDAGLLPDDVDVKFTIVPSTDNAYQNALDQALLDQENVSDDEKIDMFLLEADYALKYVDSEYTLDVINDVGLTEEDLAVQYKYTQEIVTDSNGVIKGTSWQATPGLFAYRRSIAEDVLGSDDPEVVQEALSTWDKFYEVAEQADAKGYKMLSGYDDAYRVFSNNMSGPWVDENKVINVDDSILAWIEQTKDFTDKGYTNKSRLWDDQWQSDQGPGANVFGFFYSTWGINFTLLDNSLEDLEAEKTVGNGIYGDYGVVYGPQNYYWGGSWIAAAKGSDDLDLVKDIMLVLTTDKDTMLQITKDTQDFTNHEQAMTELAADDSYASDFLGGQNHIRLFVESAKGIDMSNISPYDQGMNEHIQTAFADYFNGNVDFDTALDNFYKAVIEIYPELKRPE